MIGAARAEWWYSGRCSGKRSVSVVVGAVVGGGRSSGRFQDLLAALDENRNRWQAD